MTPTELQQFLRDKLRKAYNLGQTWWQQADSEYRRENKKADETAAKFAELVENVVLAVTFELNRAGATEAAKATGTAGELPPKQNLTLDNAPIGTMAPSINGGAWYRTERGWKWNNGSTFPRPGGDWNGELIAPTEAARQPAPVSIKPWHERIGENFTVSELTSSRDEEIADLRAALAATNRSQP